VPELLTVLVMRDPIERLLASDGRLAMYGPNPSRRRRRRRRVLDAREKKGYPDRTAATWDDYALHSYYADNYALRILGDRTGDVVNTYNLSIPWDAGGQDMLPTDVVDGEMVARARRVVQSATVVIDLACLSESLQWLSEQLNLSHNGSRSEFMFSP
jgi:hypothetical protein